MFSTELEETLRDDFEIHLQMIQEQKELKAIARQQVQRAREYDKQKLREEYEKEQARINEEEAKAIKEEKERSEKECLIAEGERLRLQAQEEAIKKDRQIQLEKLEKERLQRIEQQQRAEQALKELELKKIQAAELARQHKQSAVRTQIDGMMNKELQDLQSKLPSPEIRTEPVKQTEMLRYPSMETLDETEFQELNKWQRLYYQRKEQALTDKLTLAESVYFSREGQVMSLEQAQLYREEYDTLKQELERRRRICFHKLLLPSKEIPKYPTLPSVRTPPPEMNQEWVNYYLDKQEELQKIQEKRYLAYLSLLVQATSEEEKEHIKAEGLLHEQRAEKLLKKISNGLEKKFKRQQTTPNEEPKTKRRESTENDYLELERTLSTPEVLEVTKQRLEEMIRSSSQTQEKTNNRQQQVVETISQNLQGMGMTKYEPKDESPKERRIHYTKEIGRNGGIERPTSTEARKSQQSAIQTAREFFSSSSTELKRSGKETPIGEPQQDLDWDGLQEQIGRKMPQEDELKAQFNTINDSNKTAIEMKSVEIRTRSPEVQKKEVPRERRQKRRNNVPTMSRPPFTRRYKRKRGDPTGKVYVDAGMYGDEKDDLYGQGECGSEMDIALFDLVCERCRGDHIKLYCPYNSEGDLKQKIPKQGLD